MVAFPLRPDQSPHALLSEDSAVDDLVVSVSDPTSALQRLQQREAINQKYLAGFIDPDGVFHPNHTFMTDQPANLAPDTHTEWM